MPVCGTHPSSYLYTRPRLAIRNQNIAVQSQTYTDLKMLSLYSPERSWALSCVFPYILGRPSTPDRVSRYCLGGFGNTAFRIPSICVLCRCGMCHISIWLSLFLLLRTDDLLAYGLLFCCSEVVSLPSDRMYWHCSCIAVLKAVGSRTSASLPQPISQRWTSQRLATCSESTTPPSG